MGCGGVFSLPAPNIHWSDRNAFRLGYIAVYVFRLSEQVVTGNALKTKHGEGPPATEVVSSVCQIIHTTRLAPGHAYMSRVPKPSGVAYLSVSCLSPQLVHRLPDRSLPAILPAASDDCLDHHTCHRRASDSLPAARRSYTKKPRRPDEHRGNFCIQKSAEDL